jgi:hypothetical protein
MNDVTKEPSTPSKEAQCLKSSCPRNDSRASDRKCPRVCGQPALTRMPLRTSGSAVGKVDR